MFFNDMKLLERVFWLKRIKGSGNPMHEATSTSGSFVTDVVAPLKKLLVNLSPIQSGSGTPSPDNVRPISGHTEVVTIVSPTTDAEDGTSYTTDLGRIVYGGTLDVVSGELVVDKGFAIFDGSETWTKNTRALNGFYTSRPQGCKQSTTMVSNSFTYVDSVQDLYNTYGACFCGSSMNFNVDPTTIGGDTIEDWKAWLANNPLQVVYELTSPQTYQLTRQQINSLIGQNNIITEDGVEVSEIVYMTRLVGTPLLGSPQTEEPTEEMDEDPAEESETE